MYDLSTEKHIYPLFYLLDIVLCPTFRDNQVHPTVMSWPVKILEFESFPRPLRISQVCLCELVQGGFSCTATVIGCLMGKMMDLMASLSCDQFASAINAHATTVSPLNLIDRHPAILILGKRDKNTH